MKICVIGGLGYVGRAFLQLLNDTKYECHIVDAHWFKAPLELKSSWFLEEKDIRLSPLEASGDACVYLSAVSNDPMGKKFKKPTYQINRDCAVQTAYAAKKLGYKNFIFASSCSVYGGSGFKPRIEEDALNPLTDYAISKVEAESLLREIADENFKVTCLRFATACGASKNMRLDLALNDFVISGLSTNSIEILSDGSPWRPFIHVNDMAKAMLFCCETPSENKFEVFNVGTESFNYQIKELASKIANRINCEFRVLGKPGGDARSYAVNFQKFHDYTDGAILKEDLFGTVDDIKRFHKEKLNKEGSGAFSKFRENKAFIRFKALQYLIEKRALDKDLFPL